MFTRSGSTWSEQAKLTGAGESGSGEFGESAALSENGNTAMVGASVDGANEGAVWVFTRSGTTWTQQGEKLKGAGESGAGEFGYGVALSGSGNTALIGGPYDNGSIGAAWVFTRTGETWSQQGGKITGSGEAETGFFGRIVALSANADNAIIGGYGDTGAIGAVWAFGASPTVTTGAGAERTQSEAKLNGTVNPDGQEVTACTFEYGLTTSYGSPAACSTKPGSGTSPVAVSAPVTGLKSNTTYHFRLAATNSLGTSDGEDQTFTTLQTFNTGKTEEFSKPAKAKDGELSAEASGGTGAVTAGVYGTDIGGAVLRGSNGKYVDVYRSSTATFSKIEFKDCELGGAKTIWWYDQSTGWLPLSAPTAVYTETPTPCITVTITETSTPDVQEMTGMRYGLGEQPGEQEFGKCLAQKKGSYTEGNCLTEAEKNGAPDHKGSFEWHPAPDECFTKKKGHYSEPACLTLDEKKGKGKGKYEKGSNAFTGSSGTVKLETKGAGTIECKAASISEGLLRSLKTATETLTLSGCERESAKCTSSSQSPGTIRSNQLETLTYEAAGKYFTGIAGNPIATFTCGTTAFTLLGEVSGETSGDVNAMTTTSQTEYKPGSGYQAGLKADDSSASYETTLTATLSTSAAQGFEIAEKAKG